MLLRFCLGRAKTQRPSGTALASQAASLEGLSDRSRRGFSGGRQRRQGGRDQALVVYLLLPPSLLLLKGAQEVADEGQAPFATSSIASVNVCFWNAS